MDRKLILILSASVLVVIIIGIFRPKEIDWTPTFEVSDKIPYGSYVLYHSLPQLFGTRKVELNNKQPFAFTYKGSDKSFLFVQDEFKPTPTNTRALLQLANAGNDIFISAGYIAGSFADSLKLSQEADVAIKPVMRVIDNDSVPAYNVNFSNPQLRTDSGYWYRRGFLSYYYDVSDTAFLNQGFAFNTPAKDVTVLGADSRKHPNFICIGYGAGRIFLHNNPFAFTNYYLLQSPHDDYAAKCLSYLKGQHIVWDEYFKHDEGDASEATLRFLYSHEPLRWAYYIVMSSLLLYVLFNMKRKQRMIPVVEPYHNTSLEFTRLVGSLYYNQSDFKDIMTKKVNYLLEFIRNRYNLDTKEINNEFIAKLSDKSGVDAEQVSYLFTLVHGVMQKNWLSKQELVELNMAIQTFKTQLR